MYKIKVSLEKWRQHVIAYKYSKGLSAPALCIIALLLTVGLGIIEKNEREIINDGIMIQIDVDDTTSESGDWVSDGDDFDIPALESDEDIKQEKISDQVIKESTIALSKLDFSKKVLWRIHRIKPLKGFSEDDKNKILFQTALKLFSKGDYEKTYTLIGKLPRQMRHKERPGFYYALALTKGGKIDQAIRAYQGQLERFPHHQASAINYGLLLNDAEKYKQAIKAFKYAATITSSRRKAKSLRNMATAYYELNEYKKAVKYYKKSIEYQPTNSTTWLMLAEAQQQLPKYSQAEVLETYRKSIQLAPNRYTPALKRANYLFSELMFAQAAEDYAEARKRSGHLSDTALMQSINYLAAGDLEAADKSLNSVKQASNDEEQLIELIKILSTQNYDDAKDLIKEIDDEKYFSHKEWYDYLRLKLAVIENDKDFFKKFDKKLFEHPIVGWPVKLEYARGLLQQEQYEEAQKLASKIAQALPNSAEAQLINGQLKLHSGQEIPGFNSLKHAYHIYPESRRVAFIYAKSHYDFEHYKQTVSIIQKLLQEHPKDIEALELKAKAHHALGQNELARSAYTEAFELDDKNLHSAFALAQLESDLGNDNKSLAVLQEILERDSSHIKARQFRAQLLCESRDYKQCLDEANNILKLDEDNKPAKELIEKYKDRVASEETDSTETDSTETDNKNDSDDDDDDDDEKSNNKSDDKDSDDDNDDEEDKDD